MTITLRDTKGSALTHAELDGNFEHLNLNKQEVFGAYKLSLTTTDADPGSGYLRFNVALESLVEVEFIYIDKFTSRGTEVSAWIQSFGESIASVKGHLTIQNNVGGSQSLILQVTGSVIDTLGYLKIPVSYLSGSLTGLTEDTNLSVSFSPVSETSLAQLFDVLISSPANDQVLKFNGTQWVNGTASGGSINWSDQSARTSNFNSVAGVWQEIEITGAGNIIGTLPVSPTNNEEHLFYCRATATDPGGRFRMGLNGKVINGRTDAATETRAANFNAGTIASNFAALGGSISGSGWIHYNNNQLLIADPPGLTWTMPLVAEGSVFTCYAVDAPANQRPNIYLNGVRVWYDGQGSSVNISIPNGQNTMSFPKINEDTASIYDNFQLTNVALSTPAAWTDVVPWQLNSGGRLVVRWNSTFQSWAVLDYYKGIYT